MTLVSPYSVNLFETHFPKSFTKVVFQNRELQSGCINLDFDHDLTF